MSRLDDAMSSETSARPLGFLPTWWEGESRDGWCSRLHALRGDKNRTLERLLFGREHACCIADIPSGLGRLMHVTGGQLGTAEETRRHRPRRRRRPRTTRTEARRP